MIFKTSHSIDDVDYFLTSSSSDVRCSTATVELVIDKFCTSKFPPPARALRSHHYIDLEDQI